MNEKLTALLDQLAVKLGTTVDYLWKVLVKQAHVEATKSLIILILAIIYGFIVVKSAKKVYKKDDEIAIPGMVVLIVSFVVSMLYALSGINDIFNGYFNPEYWALKEILDTIK